eukprot:Gb_37675 [translate_table: standard]
MVCLLLQWIDTGEAIAGQELVLQEFIDEEKRKKKGKALVVEELPATSTAENPLEETVVPSKTKIGIEEFRFWRPTNPNIPLWKLFHDQLGKILSQMVISRWIGVIELRCLKMGWRRKTGLIEDLDEAEQHLASAKRAIVISVTADSCYQSQQPVVGHLGRRSSWSQVTTLSLFAKAKVKQSKGRSSGNY